jgi:16S rRNA (guanine527-N7)-methyltransferase
MFHVKHSQDVQDICSKNGLELSEEMVGGLEQYVSLLLEWNAKVNLISRKDQENIWGGHILHSLSMLFRLRLPAGIRVLDLGSGGGLPGIPLALVNPEWSVSLLDSIQKKCTAVQDIITRMDLSKRVEVIVGRAEEKSVMDKRRVTFDVVVARGVGSLADLVRYAKPYLKKGLDGGTAVEDERMVVRVTPPVLIAYKGGDLEGEIKEMRLKTGRTVAADLPITFAGAEESGLTGKTILVVPVNRS